LRFKTITITNLCNFLLYIRNTNREKITKQYQNHIESYWRVIISKSHRIVLANDKLLINYDIDKAPNTKQNNIIDLILIEKKESVLNL